MTRVNEEIEDEGKKQGGQVEEQEKKRDRKSGTSHRAKMQNVDLANNGYSHTAA